MSFIRYLLLRTVRIISFYSGWFLLDQVNTEGLIKIRAWSPFQSKSFPWR